MKKNNTMTNSKKILNYIIKEKAQGNSFQELNVQMRIMMKGINVKGILEERISEEIEKSLTERLLEIAKEFDVDLQEI